MADVITLPICCRINFFRAEEKPAASRMRPVSSDAPCRRGAIPGAAFRSLTHKSSRPRSGAGSPARSGSGTTARSAP
ncbi:hypothetical protein A8B82_10870 [Sulfitobacter sp. EhC04]|nr:hypothetical protein A8B82_10870 [Sulfitobacter sp. EhC04]